MKKKRIELENYFEKEIEPKFNFEEYPEDYAEHPFYLSFLTIAHKYSLRQAAKGAKLTEHHISPTHYSKHKTNSKDPKFDKKIQLTYYYHGLAHKVLFLLYGIVWDYCAYRGLIGGNSEVRQEIQKAIVAKNRKNKVGFFDREIQLELARRPKSNYFFRSNPEEAKRIGQMGGITSGKVWTEKKRQSSVEKGKKLGKESGRKGGLKSISPLLKKMINCTIYWKHTSGVCIKTPPQQAVIDYVKILNSVVPYSVKNSSGISAILRNVEPRRYGWEIISVFPA
jgi:hypothetical protein